MVPLKTAPDPGLSAWACKLCATFMLLSAPVTGKLMMSKANDPPYLTNRFKTAQLVMHTL
jgi:hypothetical protein